MLVAAASSLAFAAPLAPEPASKAPPASKASPASAPQAAASTPAGVDTRLDWFKQTRFGMFIHFGLYSTLEGKWGDRTNHAEWIRTTAKIPVPEYEKLLAKFNPVKFDAKAIAKAAKDAGMGYVCITTKHHEGFALFDSKLTDWDVMSTPYGKDIMKQLAEACREQGIRMCWYYSIMDWHHPDYTPRRDWEQWSTQGADFERYVAFMKGQLKELLTNYGPIGVLWFDGQWEHNWNNTRGEDLYKYVRSLQPDIIINSRVGRAGGDYGLDRASGMLGDYATPEQVIPDKVIRDQAWETCMTMNDNWGYNAADKNFKPVGDIIRKLADIAGKGGNFLLNIGPRADGSVPPESLERLAQVGEWMRVNGESIKGTQAGPFDATPWGSCTMKSLPGGGTRLYLHVFKWPADGVIRVPGLLNDLASASILGGSAITSWDHGDGSEIVLHAPAKPANEHDCVVAIDLKGEPDVAVAPTIAADSSVFVGSTILKLGSSQKGVEVRYTTDGSTPTEASPAGSFVKLESTATVTARSFRGSRAVSDVSKFTCTKATPMKAAGVEARSDVSYSYYEGEFKSVKALDQAKPVAEGTAKGISLDLRKRDLNFALRFTGTVTVPADGVYRFMVGSDDGSSLSIDGQMVVDNDTPHSYREIRGDVALAKGVHVYELRFFENSGGFSLKAEVEGPGMKRRALAPSK